MKSAKKCVLASLLFLSFSGSIFAAEGNSTGIKQQELNKLGQSEAKGNSAYKNFAVKDDQLKQIKPDYDKTDLTSTYNSMQAPTAQGSAKKWQCMSFSDANLQQLYKSQIPTERQLALDCDAIRAAEKTNDKMQGQYGDPLENELVKLFTERQNDHIKNSGTGNVNIECSPLAGAGGADTEQKCLVQMLPVEKTCNRELKVVCYNKETGQLLEENIKCGTDKLPTVSVSSLGGWGKSSSKDDWFRWNAHVDHTLGETSEEHRKNTVYTDFTITNWGNTGRDTHGDIAWTFKYNPKEHGTPFIKYFRLTNERGNEGVDQASMTINGKELALPAGRGQTYIDLEGDRLLAANLFNEGLNTIKVSARIKNFHILGSTGGGLGNIFRKWSVDNYYIAVGFQGKCVEAVCNESWDETCVKGDVMTGDDDTDIIEDDE